MSELDRFSVCAIDGTTRLICRDCGGEVAYWITDNTGDLLTIESLACEAREHRCAQPIDVYPVGLLADLRFLYGAARHAPRHTGQALRKLTNNWRSGWRRRSYWTGYLAEPKVDNAWARAGHGWTKKRAARDLDRHLADVVDRSLDDGGGVS